MRYIYILVLLLLTSQVIIAQDSKAYDDLHRQVMSEIAATDIDYAFTMVDSLRGLATSEKERIKADQVLSYLHYQKGDKVTALMLAMENEENFIKNRDFIEQLGVIGFIASNFKELKLFNEATIYLNKAEKSLNKLPNANLKAQFGTLIYHEKVDVSLSMGKLSDAAKDIKTAYEYVDKIEAAHVKKYFLAVTLERDATLAFKKKDYEEASRLNLEALESLESKEEILYGIIHLNLARIALVNNTYDITHQHLLEVEDMVESSQFFGFKKTLHEAYIDYYTALDLEEEKSKHESIYASLIDSEMEEVGVSANLALLKMREEVNRYRYGLWAVIGVSVLVILLFIGIFYYRKRIHKSIEETVSVVEIEPVTESMQVYANENIAKITKDRILSGFRKYKISYLAKVAGFSSHSKFSSEFRQKMGKSPSKHIRNLNPS